MIADTTYNFRFELKNIAYSRFLDNSEYRDIVSPYSRMYYISEGYGQIVIGIHSVELEPGFMYLIPSFEHCSYFFRKDLAHIYIHFGTSVENGLSMYNLYSFKHKIVASELNKILFERLLEINPDLKLPHHHPNVYQKKPWMDMKVDYSSPGRKFESEAIIQLLLAGFISDFSKIDFSSNLKYNIPEVLKYIHENLHNNIRIDELAQIACLSKDHFSRVFNSIFGISPCEFIIRKRIEKSQFLLLTTDLSIAEIIEETNFKSAPYFSRMFKKFVSISPSDFRKNQLFNH